MTNWQITAKTIYCSAAQAEVTIIVKKDWSTQCTGYDLHTQQAGQVANCEGLNCSGISEYVAQLKREEDS